ncbi:purine-nucleoside phosphorylase [Aggregatilinea lenta]|uniref:purine-nucleoside phosphorylase n=1 Tax=Aggregatilinea lenta TaxID=913108 RepID=UPI000E5BD888|nr:purine nucleoside permease [Aggregatilinea lenta]
MGNKVLTKSSWIIVVLALALALTPAAAHRASAQGDAPRAVKVLVVSMFEVGEPTGDTPGEAQSWIEGEGLDEVIDVSGSYSPVYCNADDLCLVVTGMGTANATATLMAVGLSGQFDLSQAYILVAGIAGIDPADGTLGSAAWAEWVVDGDVAHEYDAREMPEGWDYPYFRLGCDDPWCDDGSTAGTEVYHLNAALAETAFALSQDAALTDSDGAIAYRANYPADLPASQPPSVLRCDTLAASTYWHGALLSGWAQWWMEQWTDGAANYCTTEMEDSGTLTALTRMAESGVVDLDRVMVLRTASNFDQPYPGQTAAESMAASSGGFIPSVVNAYVAGSAVTDAIVADWETWQAGVPEMAAQGS